MSESYLLRGMLAVVSFFASYTATKIIFPCPNSRMTCPTPASYYGGERQIRSISREAINKSKVLIESADEINKSCPVRVDDVTRLDGVKVEGEDRFVYRCTLLASRDVADNVLSSWNENMRPQLLKNYQNDKAMATFRAMRVALVYQYSDEANNQLAEFTVSPNER